MQISGRCHCGHITFEAEIDATQTLICHCTDCQRLTGSPFRVTVIAEKHKVSLTKNRPKSYTKMGDNGNVRYQLFCPECGSPVFTTGEGDDADTWGIRWGSIDQREQIIPQHQLWQKSAVDWLDSVCRLPASLRD